MPKNKEIYFLGRVLAQEKEAPICGAKVSLNFPGAPPVVYTDLEGIYRFKVKFSDSKIVEGQAKIEAKGYKAHDLLVKLSPENRDLGDIRLAVPPVTKINSNSSSISSKSIPTNSNSNSNSSSNSPPNLNSNSQSSSNSLIIIVAITIALAMIVAILSQTPPEETPQEPPEETINNRLNFYQPSNNYKLSIPGYLNSSDSNRSKYINTSVLPKIT